MRALLPALVLLPALAASVACGARPAFADDERLRAVPEYVVPAGVPSDGLAGPRADLVRRAVQDLRDPPSPEIAQEAARLISAVGAPALPAVVDVLRDSSWFARAALVSAVAEMDAPEASELLVAAASDPSFAVREVALRGIGKTGDARAAAVLPAFADAVAEPAWRVRSAAAVALRRATRRGVLSSAAAHSGLVALLRDRDADTRRAALRAAAPLAIPEAVPLYLAVYEAPESREEERRLALGALRAYRDGVDELVPALRRGLIETDDPVRAAEAGAALLDIAGSAVLDDPQVSSAVIRQLADAGAYHLRAALGRLGPAAAPWLRDQAAGLAHRIASRRITHVNSPIEFVVETLLEVRREAGFQLVADFAVGDQSDVLAPETRLFALRKVHLLFAHRLAAPLREAFDDRRGDGVRRVLLQAIVASGGDDLVERVDDALLHPDADARSAAFAILLSHPGIAVGPNLRKLAAADPSVAVPGDALRTQRRAVEALARRSPDEAADIALGLLSHPHADVRREAAGWVATAARPEDFSAVLARLAEEDGSDPRDAQRPPAEGAVTPSTTTPAHSRRRRIRKALLQGVRACGGERAREPLFDVAGGDAAPDVREAAIRLLRGVLRPGDDAKLLRLREAEEHTSNRTSLLVALATLADSERARALFTDLVADARSRLDALLVLRRDDARVVPDGLAEGVHGEDWDDAERAIALEVLGRAGRPPAPAVLADMVRERRSPELLHEALRLLAESRTDEAAAELRGLLATAEEPELLEPLVETLGRLRATDTVPELVRLMDTWRDDAFGAIVSTESAVGLYGRLAEALGRCGTIEAGRALARHLLQRRTSRAVARFSTPRNGPFSGRSSPPVKLTRALVRALALFDEPTCRRLVDERLHELAAESRGVRLDQGFVDGVARYLHDPEAHRLPPRRRPSAAFPLFRLVRRIAPRLSALDVDAQAAVAARHEQRRRYAQAAEAYAERLALESVDGRWKSPSEAQAERVKLSLLRGLAALAEGDAAAFDEAASSARSADPGNGTLAYLHGWALVKAGRAGAPAEESLRHAVAMDEQDARPLFYLAWTVEQTDGPESALPLYRRAVELDRRRVQNAGGAYLTHRNGLQHQWAHYHYWAARAAARTGDVGAALEQLDRAVKHDDRDAARALIDPVLAELEGVREAVESALSRFPGSVPRGGD